MPKVPVKYDTSINIRVDSDMILELQKIANEKLLEIHNSYLDMMNHKRSK